MALSFTSILRSTILQVMKPNVQMQGSCQLHQLAARLTAIPFRVTEVPAPAPGAPVLQSGDLRPAPSIGGAWSLQSVRHKIRNNFPKPREIKRIKFTWYYRMKTPGGRMLLMRRILKGRHTICHPY